MSEIDSYVTDVAARLALRPAAADRLLAEIEDHLHSAAEHSAATGLSREEAEALAVRRFGAASEIAFAANGGFLGLATRTASALARIGAVGAAAVLAGTLLAQLAARFTSTAAVFGLPASASPSRSSISHWLTVQPSAGDWRTAAALENADDSLILRGGAALLLLAGCTVAGFVTSRRYTVPRARWTTLWPALAFTGAAAVLLLSAAADIGMGDAGRGQALSDAAVAVVAGAAYWVRFVRQERASVAG